MLCPLCKEEIQEGALKCKHCVSMLIPAQASLQQNETVQDTPTNNAKAETIALPITSMVLGIVAVLGGISVSHFDKDALLGTAMLSLAGLILGIVCVAKQKKGKGMAIAGIVLGSVGILIVL